MKFPLESPLLFMLHVRQGVARLESQCQTAAHTDRCLLASLL